MTIAQAALARAKALKEDKPTTSKPTSKAAEKTKTRKSSGRGASDAEKAKVVQMFKAGKPTSEISEAMGWVKKGDWPHYYTLGVIRQLRKQGALGYHRAPEKKSKKK